MKLDDLWEEYSIFKKNRLKPSSYYMYWYIYKKSLSPAFGHLEIGSITHKLAEKWALEQNANGQSSSSVCDKLVLLNNILDYAQYTYDIALNKIRIGKISLDKRSSLKRINCFSPQEIKNIQATAKDNPNSFNMLILLMLFTGIRIGEASALRLKDVDVENKLISVNSTLERIHAFDTESFVPDDDMEVLKRTKNSIVLISRPKTEGSIRDIPLSGAILSYLKHAKKMYDDSFFLSTMSDKYIEPRTFRSMYARFLKECKITRYIRPHGLRHTFATSLVTSGVDFRTVAELLGHTDVGTTLNIYSHATLESKQKAVQSAFKKILK